MWRSLVTGVLMKTNQCWRSGEALDGGVMTVQVAGRPRREHPAPSDGSLQCTIKAMLAIITDTSRFYGNATRAELEN